MCHPGNLYRKRHLFGDDVTAGLGQVEVTDYSNLFPLATPVRSFRNLVFSVSPAIPAPNQGLGAAAGGWFSDPFYGIAITPDIQGLINPARNPEEDVIGIFGSRERIIF